jgi:hypothetical protein
VGRLPMQPTGNHEVQHQPEVAIQADTWRIVPPPTASFQSQLISRTTPIFSSLEPAQFQTQALPHAILKAEGNANVPCSLTTCRIPRTAPRNEELRNKPKSHFRTPIRRASEIYGTNPIPVPFRTK